MRKFFVLVSEEFNENFASPTLEFLVFFFLLLSFVGFTTSSTVSTMLYLPGISSPESSSASSIWAVSDFMTMIIQIMLAMVVSALIARSLAAAFESGLMRTLLSYPIGKSSLILAKLAVTVLISGGIITGGIVAFIPISGLYLLPLSSILGLIASIWITLLMVSTSAVVLSLILKNESMVILPSMFVWVTLIVLAPMMPNLVLSAIIRPNLALAYIGLPQASLTNTQIAEALIGSSTIIAVMLTISMIYSSKFMEC